MDSSVRWKDGPQPRRWPSWLRWSTVAVLVSLLVLDLAFPPPLPKIRDTSTLVVARDGTPLREVMAALADNPQVVAVGINCIALENTPAALAHLHSLTALPLVVYPNSGEHYDAVSKTWHHHGEACASLADYLPQWQAAGARLIGGCCRTTPADIAALKARS